MRSKKVISLLDTIFFLPDKDIVSIDISFFLFVAHPAMCYNLLYFKKNIKGFSLLSGLGHFGINTI